MESLTFSLYQAAWHIEAKIKNDLIIKERWGGGTGRRKGHKIRCDSPAASFPRGRSPRPPPSDPAPSGIAPPKTPSKPVASSHTGRPKTSPSGPAQSVGTAP